MSARTRRPTWLWPAAAIAIVVVLAVRGRHLVAGVLFAIALIFALFVVGVLLWMLVSMALPGRSWTADDPRDAVRTALDWVRSSARGVRVAVGQAPWRGPQAVVNRVAGRVGRRVAELPSGPAAYPYLRIALSPSTEAELDAWMPIEDVARIWARAYAEATASTTRTDDTVTVVVAVDPATPRGRALIGAGFRAPDDAGAVALARWPLRGPRGAPGPGLDGHTAMRLDRPRPDASETDRQPDQDSRPGTDGTLHLSLTSLDRDGTIRLPSAGPRPVATGDTTVRRGPYDAGRGAAKVAAPPALLLVRINTATGQPAREDPLVATAPRATIGRAADRDLRIPGSHVSRVHAELRHNGGWAITDQHSQGGTFVNGTRIPPELPHPLRNGDTVEFARPRGGEPRTLYRVE